MPTAPTLTPRLGREDPVNAVSDPHQHWTTTNVGEAAPGVQTPLSWSLWSTGDVGMREMAYRIGVLRRAERRSATDADRVFQVFCGRSVLNVEFLVLLGDRMPGTTGQQVAESILGRIPDDITYRPTNRRIPVIAWRFPLAALTAPGRVRRYAHDTDTWYHRTIDELTTADEARCRTALREAAQRLEQALIVQAVMAFSLIEPLYGLVQKLVTTTGRGDTGILSGSGGAEVAGMVTDLWRASRDELDLAHLVAQHGFHGPAEGELSSRVWRQDPEPLRKRITEYRALPDTADPRLREHDRTRQREQMIPHLAAALPPWQRPAVRALLRLAARCIPMRGIAKRSMLQAFDAGRAAATRLGTHHAANGTIADPDDIFYFTVDELTTSMPTDPRVTVARRRQDRLRHQAVDLPGEWVGNPQPRTRDDTPDLAGSDTIVTGIGVSSGSAEGTARVITDPDDMDIDPGDILIAPTTDPSWAAIMMMAGALVVDIGGALSHAAVVARELGIPCIVNTRTGTRTIHTGDHLRVNGGDGTVEILNATPHTTPDSPA